MKKYLVIIAFIVFCGGSLVSQEEEKALFFNIKYGVQLPAGDLSDRFGAFFNAGIDPELYFGRNHLFFGLHFNFLFGQTVKEDPLAAIRDSQGEIIGRDQSYAIIDQRMRGLTFGGHIGKLFPFSASSNHTFGLRLSAGGGILIHRIGFKDENDTANQLRGAYGDGYNRKTVGAYLNQFVGFQFLSQDRRIIFRAGFTFHQGFSESVRAVDFDTKLPDNRKRSDLMNGFEIGWVLPIFLSPPGTIYY